MVYQDKAMDNDEEQENYQTMASGQISFGRNELRHKENGDGEPDTEAYEISSRSKHGDKPTLDVAFR